MKGVKHYKRDGAEWKGASHKMPNGQLHSGKTHGKSSQRLYLKDLMQPHIKKQVKNNESL
jgi:hypothetical protein